MQLTQRVKSTIKDAAKKLTGNRKRDFMAKVSEDYCEGSARKAETIFGWNQHSVQLGLQERRTGIICIDNYQAKGCHKSEERLPNLEADIRSLVDTQAQADPKFQQLDWVCGGFLRTPLVQSTFYYARISARAVREALIREKGYSETQLPTRQTIGEILNRLGYRLKKPKKPNL